MVRGREEGIMFIGMMFALLHGNWIQFVTTEDYSNFDDFKYNSTFINSTNTSLIYEIQMDAISSHQLQTPPRMKTNNQRSTICIPITHKKYKDVKLLYRSDFNDSNTMEDSPLQRAARLGREQEVAYLLSSGINASTVGMFKRTPLHWAAFNGYGGIIMLLIVNGASINSKDKWDYTPLHLAVENGHTEPVQILIKSSAITDTKNIEGRTPILDAARNGYLDLLSILLDYNNVNISMPKPFLSTPLHEAAIGNHINLVNYLIGKGADLNAMDEMKRTPLHWAVFYNYEDLAFLLISKGAGLNRKDCDGMSPLHISALKGYKKITEMLIKYGAFKNSRSKKGHTPLHEAAHNGQKEIVQLLIKEGAELEKPGSEASDGSTPLFEAVEGGYSEIVRILIDHGARFNLTNSMGKTPLHRAVEKDNKDIVNLLVQKGAEITAEDYWGYTPFAIACEQGNMEILQQLFLYCVCYNYTKNCQCLSVDNDVVGLPIACQCIAAKGDTKDGEVISVTAKSVNFDKCPCFMIKRTPDNKETCTSVPQIEAASRGLCLKASDFNTKKFANRPKKINCPLLSNSESTNSTVCLGHVVKFFRNMLDNNIMFH
ncbi:serine/threonine-protein phosphatase 6 regulatory ankyrin repeat subunit B-like isoform X2 [Halyomorpha halys]|nr:ankyrin repeat, PH and SEC7 domain containing protein secG-like [Halyomorpha halys]